jgi:ApaG protein
MADSSKYEITIVPRATYVEDQSDPSKDQYVFAYTITISNTGNIPAQLISRHWIITDSHGKVPRPRRVGSSRCSSPARLRARAAPISAGSSVGTMHGATR